MATGFTMESWMVRCGNFSLSLVMLAAFSAPALAAGVTLVGLIGAKAIIVIDGGAPRTLAPGQKTAEGVVLLGIEKEAASFDINGQKRTLSMGRAYSAAPRDGRRNVAITRSEERRSGK